LSSVSSQGLYSDFLFYKKLSLLPHAKMSLTTHPRKLRTTLNGQILDGSHCRIKCPLKDSYKNTIEAQSQGTYFLLRFSNRKKWSFCNKSGSKACSINQRSIIKMGVAPTISRLGAPNRARYSFAGIIYNASKMPYDIILKTYYS